VKGRGSILTKYHGNPILYPRRGSIWESRQVFNAGAVYLDDKIHLIYRAIGEDYISRFGYALSTDGFNISERSINPIYSRRVSSLSKIPSSSGGGFGGCEDPRLVYIADEKRIYMTYTAYGVDHLAVGMTRIHINDFLKKRWNWDREKIISPWGEVHKNFTLFPERINGKYAILHSITPRISIKYLSSLEFKDGEYINSKYENNSVLMTWEYVIKGVGAPPIKTREGWILFHHGIDKREPWKYKIGVMLLNLSNPEEVLYKSNGPILEPTEKYEYNGFKPSVVYLCGAIIRHKMLLLYYGAADTYLCIAYTWLDEFLNKLMDGRI